MDAGRGFNRACTRGSGFLRILCGLFWLLIYAPYNAWVGAAPPTFFAPPHISVMALASGFPSTPVMWLSDILYLALSCCILLGVRTRLVLPSLSFRRNLNSPRATESRAGCSLVG